MVKNKDRFKLLKWKPDDIQPKIACTINTDVYLNGRSIALIFSLTHLAENMLKKWCMVIASTRQNQAKMKQVWWFNDQL